MTSKLYLLIFVVLVTCSNSQRIEGDNKNSFNKFLEKFNSITLPFSIIGGKDILAYNDTILNSLNDFVSNPILNPLDHYEFIKTKYPIDNDHKYYGVCKNKINNYYLVFLKQDNWQKVKFRLMLNIFDLDGKLLDTLYVAGRSMPEFKRYCSITKDLHITTYYYSDIVDDFSKKCQKCNFYATEIRNNYIVSDEGKFILTKEIKERAYFTLWGERNIVSRVDTIDGKYRFNNK
jgi:hypothetical protein